MGRYCCHALSLTAHNTTNLGRTAAIMGRSFDADGATRSARRAPGAGLRDGAGTWRAAARCLAAGPRRHGCGALGEARARLPAPRLQRDVVRAGVLRRGLLVAPCRRPAR